MHRTPLARPMACLLLAGLFLALPAAASPPREATSDFDPRACDAALQRLRSRPKGGGSLEDVVRHCDDIHRARECRDAWERTLTMKGAEARLGVIVEGCTRAYCASLSPRPKLCDPTPRWLTPQDLAAQWPEFQQAVLTHDHGAKAGALTPGFTALLLGWTETNLKLLTSQRVLQLVKTPDHLELELRDEQGRLLRGWTFEDLPSSAQMRELREQVKQFPKVSPDRPVCARLDATPKVEFRQLKTVIQALMEGGCEEFSLWVLKRLPTSES